MNRSIVQSVLNLKLEVCFDNGIIQKWEVSVHAFTFETARPVMTEASYLSNSTEIP